MDARHKYLMEQLANALNLDPGAIEEFMVSDDRVIMIIIIVIMIIIIIIIIIIKVMIILVK